MPHGPPTHCHISTDFSLQVKLTIFPQPRKHLPSLLRQNFAWTRTHTNIGTWNRYYVRVPHTIFSIHLKVYSIFYRNKTKELQPTVPLSFLPLGKPYRGSNVGSFIGCGVPSGSEYKAQPFPIIEHYYETFSLKTWHLPTRHTHNQPTRKSG